VDHIKKLLHEIGLEDQRVHMINVSAAMGAQFASLAGKVTEQIRNLGPNPLRNPNGRSAHEKSNDTQQPEESEQGGN
jgi:hypothetical protein